MPTAGVYVLLAALVAPSLVELGINEIAAHLFMLYFGMMSMITPPVAIAAFATALGGVWLVSASVVGYLQRPLTPTMRVALTIAGLLLLLPPGAFAGAGIANLLGFILAVFLVSRETFAVQKFHSTESTFRRLAS